ncbi:MAG: PTS sugar transporter subunit IIB [Clostridium sp.]|jgi:mannose/fructose/N-acetylgalactosamine-specific phosphotransferase system component IIB|uniref:PTS sugar transporter subunit IIB n=1 Tax=Clostridium TaxID=1485 RepID=UPI00115C3B50|nr:MULTISPECIES: PTS sugar transporter subunit IIB [Clostridium]MBS5307478.1 PTS sugar transporter subunit IIB [Clostridium sp.]MBS6502130.1 PTS sugar transporter subunit IIB [Clostridium sp.]MDB1943114.1 PTS sugar transporter subunit IIB [Clostridium tertium]MDB1950215.1 PTS sugar transporter subunit IIB [Clostridium tertium]MDU2459945.1 PTS sugar transporter subunit IIB [Clostridium sp.]
MKNISLLRIDDRFIHGQVMMSWVKITKAKRIIIIDNKLVNDVFMKLIIEMAAPSGVDIDIYSEEEGIIELKKELLVSTIVLVKTPIVINNLINNGLEFDKVNVGGMGMTNGRKILFRNISATDEEMEIFRKFIKKGIDVKIQIVSTEKEYDICNYLK